jgi:hypothetical protein
MPSRRSVAVVCVQCENTFYVEPSRESTARFCSKSCAGKYNIRNKTLVKPKTGETIVCIQCGEEFYIPNYRTDSARYCSRACLWAYHNEHNRVHKVCEICGQSFEVIDFRKETARYCSRACYYKAMLKVGSVTVNCACCGKSFQRSPSKVNATAYCSIECRGIASRTSRPTSANTVRDWMDRRGALRQCSRCGYDARPEILVVHHKDRDRSHNEPSNLEVLCPNCHALEHYGKDD